MKSATALLIIFLYTFSIFRPLVPWLDYYINYDYIINVLCINNDKPEMKCHGKCHLNKELDKANDQNPQSPQKPRTVIEHKILPEALLVISVIGHSPDCGENPFYTYKQNFTHQVFKEIPVPPPRIFC